MSNPPAWREPAICPKCSEPIQSYAGNPALWGVGLHYHGNGKNVVYHQGCVSETFRELSAAKAQLAEYYARLGGVLSSGLLDDVTCGDIRKWRDEFAANFEAQLAKAREDMKEECAKVCEERAAITDNPDSVDPSRRSKEWAAAYWQCGASMRICAEAIRALKTSAVKEKNVGAE